MENFWTRDTIFQRVYKEVPTVENPEGITPQEKITVNAGELTLPEFYDTVKTLDQVIPVDYYLPGCPPPPDLVMNAINAILTGNLPGKGAVLAPDKALCDTCPLNETKPEKLSITGIKRPWEVKVDPGNVVLETYLNGELKQQGNTNDLIYSVPELINFISHVMTLLPGDIIATGTPSGIGPMYPGDTVEIKIEKIGTLRNYVIKNG